MNKKEESLPKETTTLYLIVGKSGSGKDSLVNAMGSYVDWKSIKSYTTRDKRNEQDNGHIFVTQEEFEKLRPNLVAYTYFNGHHYGVTSEELDKCNFYIIDKAGVDSLSKLYHTKRPICIIYIKTKWTTRLKRMLKRGDKLTKALSRIFHDYKAFKNIYYTVAINGNRRFNKVFDTFYSSISLQEQLISSNTLMDKVDDLSKY